jgi:dipeptidyl aminopeptidase/acylaminoacyl peptidase
LLKRMRGRLIGQRGGLRQEFRVLERLRSLGRRILGTAVLCFAAFGALGLGFSQNGKAQASNGTVGPASRLTIEDVLALRRLQTVQISPDGSRVAFVVEQAADENHSKDASYSSLWLVSTSSGEPRQLTSTPGSVASPQWSADGREIAFLATKPGAQSSQVYLIELESGQIRQLTRHTSSVTAFSWSPDGKTIAFLATTADAVAPEHQRKINLGYDAIDVGASEPIQRRHPRKLWVVDLQSAKSRSIEIAAPHIMTVQWSPTGTELLLTVAERPYADWEQLRPRIVTVSPSGGTPKLYCSTLGKISGLSWAPDGKSVGFLGSLEKGTDFFPNGLFVCRGQGSTPVDLSASSSYAVESFRWMPDGQSLLVAVAEGADRALAKLNIQRREITRLTPKPSVLAYRSDYGVSRNSNRIACILASSAKPPEIWSGVLSEPRAGNVNMDWKRLTQLNPHLDARVLGEGEIVNWKAPDGWEISGILLKPVGYRAGTRYPLIVYVHGSNGGEANDFHLHQNDWGQLLAANGYAVLLPNYRGSIMGSSQFRRGARGDYGGKDFLDVLAGVDSMIERGIADPARLGVGGISYGGYLTNLCATRTTRFRAAVSVAGFSNWVTFHGGESSAPEAAEKLEWGESTYENFDLLWQHSPIMHVRNARTATLLILGEEDPGIPLHQGLHLFRGLTHFGVPSQLIVYPREGHGLREPNHLRDYYRRILEWFGKYLK